MVSPNFLKGGQEAEVGGNTQHTNTLPQVIDTIPDSHSACWTVFKGLEMPSNTFATECVLAWETRCSIIEFRANLTVMVRDCSKKKPAVETLSKPTVHRSEISSSRKKGSDSGQSVGSEMSMSILMILMKVNLKKTVL
jgi:hypothetical protein